MTYEQIIFFGIYITIMISMIILVIWLFWWLMYKVMNNGTELKVVFIEPSGDFAKNEYLHKRRLK